MSHELDFKQWHHGYLGFLIGLFGIYVVNSETIRLIGSIVLWDDVFQHFIQWKWDDSYTSPLRYFYNKWIWEPLNK